MTRQQHLLTAAVVAATAVGVVTPATAAPPAAQPTAGATADTTAAGARPLATHTVTLVTGDVVHLTTLPGGRQGATVDPAAGSRGEFHVYEERGHVHVTPAEALPYLDSGQLDPALFDVTALVQQGYDDAHSSTLPLILTGPANRTLAARPPATPKGARRGVELRSVGGVAVRESRAQAHAFWESIDDDTPGDTATLSGGVGRVWLDRKVRAALDQSVPQIGAPAAWQAGYDGHGVKVAVLDTGYDPTHPDLAGRVSEARNFTAEADVTDGHGHGTHVASTIAGSGAASDGRRRGVAPGADLIVGKVLDNQGFGSSSEIIAGMEWATGQGARVVNMSLGGDPTDGTDPMSEAVNRLTASTGALFVVAAGNLGAFRDFLDFTVGTPGAATSALTVGAVSKQDELAEFSSRGPRMGDGTVKPEIVAPGVDIVAARARGTSLDTPVDEYYTSASGTSMATPHVAGAAAILAQEHPDWTAEQLKAALVATAHHLDGPTPNDQGAGRVDVAAAYTQQVVPSTGSVALGRIRWRDGGRDPVVRTVSYRNDSDRTVTLDVSSDVQNLAGDHNQPVLSVEPAQLTIPPGGSAEATLTLDPNTSVPGRYAGYLQAREADGPPLRTLVSFQLDGPLYELTVNVVDRNGDRPTEPAYVDLWNADTGKMQNAAILDGSRTYEVEPGHHTLAVYVHTVDGNGVTREITVMGRPDFTVTGNMTIDLDARTAAPVTFRGRDDVTPYTYTVAWQRTLGDRSAIAGWSLNGETMPHVSVGASDPVQDGTYEFDHRWDLMAPPFTAVVRGAHGFQVAYPTLVNNAPGFDGTRDLNLVDAGLGRPEDLAGLDVRGRAVLVTQTVKPNPDDGTMTTEQIHAAYAAGAALVLVAADRPGFYGDGALDPEIPAYVVGHDQGVALRAALAAGGGSVVLGLHGVPNSPYRYDLLLRERQGMADAQTYDLDRMGLARVDATYHAYSDRMAPSDSRMGFTGDSTVAFERFRPDLQAPGSRVEYLSTDDTTWIHHTIAGDAFFGTGEFYGMATTYTPGQRTSELWFPAITRPALPPVDPRPADGYPVNRSGDVLRFTMPEHTDGAGTAYGYGSFFSDVTDLVLTRDGTVVGQEAGPTAQFTLPADPGDYRLRLRSDRSSQANADWWTTSTRTDTTWSFHSERPAEGQRAVLPLPQFGYDLRTDEWNQVAAGRTQALTLTPGYQPGASGPGGFQVGVRVSFDDGRTWRDAPVRANRDGTLTVTLPAAPAGALFGSLRLTATDLDGNGLDQTVERAYRIAPQR